MGKKSPQGIYQDKKIKQEVHLVRPPRMEGVVKNAMVRSKRRGAKNRKPS